MKQTLKSVAVFAAMALSLVACQKEKEAPQEEVVYKHSVVFTAGTPETKTSVENVNGQAVYSWDTDHDLDRLQIFEDGNKGTIDKANSTISATSLKVKANFTTSADENTHVYTATLNGGIPTEQLSEGKYDPNADVLVAYPVSALQNQAIDFNFKRVSTVHRVTLKGLAALAGKSIESIEITSESGLVGNYTANADPTLDGTWDLANGQENKVVVTCVEEIPENGEVLIYFVTRPLNKAALTFTLTTNDNKVYAKSTPASITLKAGNVTSYSVTLVDAVYFYESFDDNNGTGGNDNLWSGSIAANDITQDNAGWEYVSAKGANKCAKFGAGSTQGSATTPEITIATSSAVLKFKAAAWNGSSETTTLNISSSSGTLSESSVTLKKGEWSTYRIQITNISSPTKITFAANQASNNRFFLDEVYVYYGEEPIPTRKLTALEWTNYTTTYDIGDKFVIDGTIQAIYDNGDKEPLTKDDVELTGEPNMDVAGETSATISYTSGTVTKSATANIIIKDPSVVGVIKTYQHVFTTKPSIGDNVTLSNVKWNISAVKLGGYNSGNYAGVQIGDKNNNGSITLTSPESWSFKKDGVTGVKIKEVRLWLNLGGTSVMPTVTIGGKSATANGTVSKNSTAGSDWTKCSKVTFTPVTGGNTGIIVIDVSTEKAGYICAIEIDTEDCK